MSQEQAKLVFNGVEYPMEQFSPEVAQLAALSQMWTKELQDQRVAVIKTETALNALNATLTEKVSAALNPPQDEAKSE